jgi:hypothetical protein
MHLSAKSSPCSRAYNTVLLRRLYASASANVACLPNVRGESDASLASSRFRVSDAMWCVITHPSLIIVRLVQRLSTSLASRLSPPPSLAHSPSPRCCATALVSAGSPPRSWYALHLRDAPMTRGEQDPSQP